jgi:hypothetical protein
MKFNIHNSIDELFWFCMALSNIHSHEVLRVVHPLGGYQDSKWIRYNANITINKERCLSMSRTNHSFRKKLLSILKYFKGTPR